MLQKKDIVNVYIVDDDELHLKILTNKLYTATDYFVKTYKSGEEFLEFMLKNPPSKRQFHIVVLDFLLSTDNNSKDGVEILRIIKDINPDMEVIMLSGHGDVDTAISSMHHGAFTFIEKTESSFARVLNNVKWLVSEKKVQRKKKESILVTKVFFALISVIIVAGIVVYFFFPNIF
ncbi:MAG TPA: hypothetical protein DDX39_11925 [Bacteroidales bacterium]|nr:MAG: hypothetical protein A2W98_10300 [Bacteroidetes bacterium GWF2_33_38]OFY72836.1 MAG: hypothetical protein A2265_11590 [Bacteroidetes bacterium RIFOXYA12_FULL_33_9]OFY91384.1 MAG: hypothetical protein A2236_12805 [Bacteroidetes bacterium RIFOXYA2_FULL_33_7]HBF89340.1 hypothetical protein [Bacteroidales bacterium]